jgi:lipopolysaccharide/colanic/teichoic acid biosynthesis glycosyltransferase
MGSLTHAPTRESTTHQRLSTWAVTIRDRVKPGITGWAQVNYPYGASVEDAREKLAYDLYYIKNRGFFLDLLILCSTVRVILFREGAR